MRQSKLESEPQPTIGGLLYVIPKYIVSAEPETSAFLSEWIVSGGFIPYERSDHALNHDGGRPRNRLYEFHLPRIRREVVMKVSRIDPRYRLSRKIDLFVTGLYKDYCKVGFLGAKALYAAGLPGAEPLAFWTCRRGIFDKRSYFLYRKLPGQTSVKKLLQKAGNEHKDCHLRLAKKLVSIIRRIHAANLRHGDFHAGNVQVHFPSPTEASAAPASAAEIQDAAYYVLDYDKVSKVAVTTPWIKRIGDLKDLSLLTIPAVGDDELLKMYFGASPPPRWSRTFKFWRNGGFSLSKQLGATPKKEGRHLAG